jgi:hypothetical protein
VLTLRGWIHGLGGAAAVTIGVVAAALIAAGLTPFHGGDGHVTTSASPQRIRLGAQSGIGSAAVAATARQPSTRTSSPARGSTPQTRDLADGSGPLSVNPGGTQSPKPRVPAPGGGHDPSAPVSGTPSTSAPAPGGGSPGKPGGGGGGGGGTGQQPGSLGGAVKNTTQQLGDTVNGATQTVGDTVGAISPVLGNTVKQTGPAVGDTVKGTGDVVAVTVDGLLGGRR